MRELVVESWQRILDTVRPDHLVGTVSVVSRRLAVEDIPMNREFLELKLDVPAGDYDVFFDNVTVEGAEAPAVTFLVRQVEPVDRWERVDIDGVGPILPITAAVAVTDADLDRLFGPTEGLAKQLVATRPGLSDRHLDETFLRRCALQDLQSGKPGYAVAAGPTGVAVEITQEAAAGQAVVIRPTLFLESGRYLTAGHAEIWAGYREGNLTAIAIDTGSGLDERITEAAVVEDAFEREVGVPLAAALDDVVELPPTFCYGDQFIANRENPWGDVFFPMHVGGITFPTGSALVIDPNTGRGGVTVGLQFPVDREFPCFVSRTSDGNMALLVRLGNGAPQRWVQAPLIEGSQDPSGHGCSIDTGTICLVDRSAAEALPPEWPAGNLLSRQIRSSEWLVASVSGGPPDLFSLLGFGGDVPNDVVLGLDSDGGVNALVVDMGGYWYPDEED